MKWKILAVVIIMGLLVGFVGAQIIISYYFPNTGNITQTAQLQLYLNDNPWVNNTNIPWGDCVAGEVYSIENMTVVNTGNVAFAKVYIVTSGLPSDWILEWQANNTALAVGAKAMGWLNLTIPASASIWPAWGFWLRGA